VEYSVQLVGGELEMQNYKLLKYSLTLYCSCTWLTFIRKPGKRRITRKLLLSEKNKKITLLYIMSVNWQNYSCNFLELVLTFFSLHSWNVWCSECARIFKSFSSIAVLELTSKQRYLNTVYIGHLQPLIMPLIRWRIRWNSSQLQYNTPVILYNNLCLNNAP
jgi:hypothetical protein